MYKVRAEIKGDFVSVWRFDSEIEAHAFEWELQNEGIWDEIEVMEEKEEWI